MYDLKPQRTKAGLNRLDDSVRLLTQARFTTREEIIQNTPLFDALNNIGAVLDDFSKRFPVQIQLLEQLGIHPITSDTMPNYFLPDASANKGHRRNIGLHTLGVAATTEILGKLIGLSLEEQNQAIKLALEHDCLKRMEIMRGEAKRTVSLGGDKLSTDQYFIEVLTGKYQIDPNLIESLLKARDQTDSANFITRILRVDKETGAIRIADGQMIEKIVLLADYMNSTSGPNEDPIWTRNVSPAEKPIVARWAELYPGIENTGYMVDSDTNQVIKVDDLENAEKNKIIGDHLTVQR